MPTRERRAKSLGVRPEQLLDGRGKHSRHTKGEGHHRWSDQRMLSSHGYVKVRVGKDHPLADRNGYAYEHLLVWVGAGKPRPGEGWLLHHRNEDKTDSRLKNLTMIERPAHSVGHNPQALTDEQVRALRRMHAAGRDTGELSTLFGIPIQRAWKIVRGMTRKSAGGPIHVEPLRNSRAGRLLDGVEHNGRPQP